MRRLLPVYLLLFCSCSFLLHANTHRPQDFLKRVKGTKDEGAQIYKHFCANCHDLKPLIPLGAPRYGEQLDWQNRLNDLNLLFKHTEEGINAMPPRGGCFECTDEQLMLALVEMVPNQAKKMILNRLSGYKKNKK